MPIHETREHPQGSAADPVGLDRVTFDHVAIAVRHPTDPWPIFADVLGGRYLDRGVNPGFGWTQLRFANGFVLEGLNPEPSDRDDFLNRFLDRNGPGPHHLTFKVPDLDRMLDRVRAAGSTRWARTGRTRPGTRRSFTPPRPTGSSCSWRRSAPTPTHRLPSPRGSPS